MSKLKPRDFLLQLVDQSNWHSMQGDEYRGYADAMERVHELILDMWDEFDAPIDRWKESDSLMQCRIDDLKAENERLRDALEKSVVVIDDWLHTYASDMCKQEHVKATQERIYKEGGTLAYIADTQARNRAALGDRHE